MVGLEFVIKTRLSHEGIGGVISNFVKTTAEFEWRRRSFSEVTQNRDRLLRICGWYRRENGARIPLGKDMGTDPFFSEFQQQNRELVKLFPEFIKFKPKSFVPHDLTITEHVEGLRALFRTAGGLPQKKNYLTISGSVRKTCWQT
jgi:hypothetical protein